MSGFEIDTDGVSQAVSDLNGAISDIAEVINRDHLEGGAEVYGGIWLALQQCDAQWAGELKTSWQAAQEVTSTIGTCVGNYTDTESKATTIVRGARS